MSWKALQLKVNLLITNYLELWGKKKSKKLKATVLNRASLVVQWLRIHLPMEGTRVR